MKLVQLAAREPHTCRSSIYGRCLAHVSAWMRHTCAAAASVVIVSHIVHARLFLKLGRWSGNDPTQSPSVTRAYSLGDCFSFSFRVSSFGVLLPKISKVGETCMPPFQPIDCSCFIALRHSRYIHTYLPCGFFSMSACWGAVADMQSHVSQSVRPFPSFPPSQEETQSFQGRSERPLLCKYVRRRRRRRQEG